MRVRSDEQLARQAAAGDQRAFAAIYARHHDALYRYCMTIVRDPDDAHDVLQTVMANALAALGNGVPDAPLRPWLFRITHNEAVSALRRRPGTAELRDDAIGADLEVTVEQRSRLRQLVTDLRALPERQRGALVMRELSGLSHAEIAAALDVSASQAKQAILEARVSLQEAEKGRAMLCPDVRTVISERDGRRLRARTVRAHLRGCDDCRALRDAIATREADLRVLAPPMASAGLLASLFGGGAVSLSTKAAVGLTAVVTAGAGVTQVARHHDRPERAKRAAAPAATSTPTVAPAPSATAVPALAEATAPATRREARRVAKLRARRRSRPAASRTPAASPSSSPSPSPAPAATVVAPAKTPTPKKPKKPKKVKPVKPVKTPKPAKTAKPVKTPKPAKTPRPEKTAKPVETPTPEATPAPVKEKSK